MPAVLTTDGITFSNATTTITDLVPAGTIICCCFTAASYTPPGFLYCNGAAISRTTYATLFGRIGTIFGVGDTVSTFNIPDMRGEFIRYWDDGRGVDSGRGFGTVQGSDFASHNHNTGNVSADHIHGGNTGNVSNDHSHYYNHANINNTPKQPGPENILNRNSFGANTGGINNNHFHGFDTGGISNDHSHNVGADGGGESRPRNIALSYFIKF